MPVLLTFTFAEVAFAAADYWSNQLRPHVNRPGSLRDALLSALLATQEPTPQTVLMCSRPQSFRVPKLKTPNVLALVAYDLRLSLDDFFPGLVIVSPTLAPVVQLHPAGKNRPLLKKYPLETGPPNPVSISLDLSGEMLVIPLSGLDGKISDYEMLVNGPQ
jgi:hypothetical protein